MTTTMRIPNRIAPAAAGATPADVLAVARYLIEADYQSRPRDLQRAIGPSQVGNPCDHCLAAQLAGWEQRRDGGWLPFIGTAVHAQFEQAMTRVGARQTGEGKPCRFLAEQSVKVGQIGGQDCWGSTDLFDTATGLVLDWKIVGETKLRKVKAAGPGVQYEAQAHLYGKGWADAGHTVNNVAIVFLPRNDMLGWDGGLAWIATYNRQTAVDALARADRIANNLNLLASISEAKRDAWITKQARDPDCRDCARYGDQPKPQAIQATIPGLIMPKRSKGITTL